MKKFWILMLAAVFLAAGLLGWTYLNRTPKTYNVVLIVIDALRADRLGAYGYHRPTTPNIDRIAAKGTLFEKAFAPLPMTQPSFASMFTSLYPHSHGIKRNDTALGSQALTLAEILKSQGWQTAAIIGASNLDSVFRLNQGFDYYDDAMGFKMNPEIKNIDHMKRWERRAEEVTPLVTRWLDKRKTDKPFFLFVHYYDPHKPYHPPAPYDTLYEHQSDKFSEASALYDGEVTYTDHHVGLLIKKLEESKLLDNTLLVITSDHGEGLGDHNWMGHIWKIYDEAVRVPLIMVGPGIPAGKKVKHLIEHVDFTPGVLEYLNLPRENHFQGHSFLPAIFQDRKIRDRILLEKAKPPWNFRQLEPDWDKFPYTQWAIRTENEKFIWSSDRKHEFYDLQADPRELTNLFPTQRERALRLFREGFDYRSRFVNHGLATPPKRTKEDNDPEEALRALGYLN